MKGLKKLLSIGLVLALLLMVMPMTALAADAQNVTGSTSPVYTIITDVDFGPVPAGGTGTVTGVITATSAATVAVAVANSGGGYVAGRLVTLEYVLQGGSTEVTITAPVTDGPLPYTVAPASAGMAAAAIWDMKATAGTNTGIWDPVAITLTIT